MINQEMIANPVLEEPQRRSHPERQLQRRNLPESRNPRKLPEKPRSQSFRRVQSVGSFFNQYLTPAATVASPRGKGKSPSTALLPKKFLSSPSGLTRPSRLTGELSDDHLLRKPITEPSPKASSATLMKTGDYLTASTEELVQNGKFSQDDLDDALAVVQDFIRSHPGVGARDLREVPASPAEKALPIRRIRWLHFLNRSPNMLKLRCKSNQ